MEPIVKTSDFDPLFDGTYQLHTKQPSINNGWNEFSVLKLYCGYSDSSDTLSDVVW